MHKASLLLAHWNLGTQGSGAGAHGHGRAPDRVGMSDAARWLASDRVQLRESGSVAEPLDPKFVHVPLREQRALLGSPSAIISYFTSSESDSDLVLCTLDWAGPRYVVSVSGTRSQVLFKLHMPRTLSRGAFSDGIRAAAEDSDATRLEAKDPIAGLWCDRITLYRPTIGNIFFFFFDPYKQLFFLCGEMSISGST